MEGVVGGHGSAPLVVTSASIGPECVLHVPAHSSTDARARSGPSCVRQVVVARTLRPARGPSRFERVAECGSTRHTALAARRIGESGEPCQWGSSVSSSRSKDCARSHARRAERRRAAVLTPAGPSRLLWPREPCQANHTSDRWAAARDVPPTSTGCCCAPGSYFHVPSSETADQFSTACTLNDGKREVMVTGVRVRRVLRRLAGVVRCLGSALNRVLDQRPVRGDHRDAEQGVLVVCLDVAGGGA